MPDVVSASADYPEGIVLLDTHMHYGEISYDDEDVQSWDQRWRPSEKIVRDLRRDWRSIPVAKVSFIANGVGGVNYRPFEVKHREDGLWPFLRWCLSLIWAMLILFYEWLREKWQNRR